MPYLNLHACLLPLIEQPEAESKLLDPDFSVMSRSVCEHIAIEWQLLLWSGLTLRLCGSEKNP